MVWASKDDKFGFGTISVDESDNITVVLNHSQGDDIDFSFNLAPPVGSNGKVVKPTQKEIDLDNKRNGEGIAIRSAYTANFPDDKIIKKFAKQASISLEDANYIVSSAEGNYDEIMQFICTPSEQRAEAIKLLRILPLKRFA